MPSNIEKRVIGKVFTWNLPDNAAIPYPIGASAPNNLPAQVGIIPKVILLTPLIWLWWLVMLYLSVPMRLKDIIISAGVTATSIFTLAYVVRLFKTEFTGVYATPELIWPVISVLILGSAWGLGKNFRTSLAAIICTIAGMVLPVLGLLTIYQGIVVSGAALLSVIWLVVINWYGWYKLEAPKKIIVGTELLQLEEKTKIQQEEIEEKEVPEEEIEFYDNDESGAPILRLDPATGDYVEHQIKDSKESQRESVTL
jgi:hypothetical protein